MALALSTTCESLLYGALEALSKLSCKLENKELNADQQREMQAISINLLHLVECLKNIMDPRVYIQVCIERLCSLVLIIYKNHIVFCWNVYPMYH